MRQVASAWFPTVHWTSFALLMKIPRRNKRNKVSTQISDIRTLTTVFSRSLRSNQGSSRLTKRPRTSTTNPIRSTTLKLNLFQIRRSRTSYHGSATSLGRLPQSSELPSEATQQASSSMRARRLIAWTLRSARRSDKG